MGHGFISKMYLKNTNILNNENQYKIQDILQDLDPKLNAKQCKAMSHWSDVRIMTYP